MTVESFHALGVSAEVAQALAARDIVTPFPIQSLVVPEALRGSDVLAKSPTGSGKTLAFGVPIVDRISADSARPAALILVPTRELALQVTEAVASIATSKGLRVEAAYGGTPVRKQANQIKGAHILVATPGRLFDFMERRLVELGGVSVLVLDEADRMLDMGFKPQVDRIVKRVPSERQTMLFSATLDGEVGELARAYTRAPRQLRGPAAGGRARRRDRPPLRGRHPGRQGRRADQGARGRARSRAGVRADEARSRSPGRRSSLVATCTPSRCTAT